MKTLRPLWGLLGVIALWGSTPRSAATATFHQAAWEAGPDRAVVLRVADGTRRVRVQTRASAGDAWQLVGVTHLPGPAGTLKLRLPHGVALENILIETSATDPFPYTFYQGETTFSQPSTGNQPGPGRTDTFATADAAGDAESAPNATAVEESDIWKWRDRTLYYFNTLRGLQIFDLADAAAPKRVAGLRLPAVGEDMYLIGAEHVALLVTRYDFSSGAENSEVRVVRHRGTTLDDVARLPVDGRFVESRLIGSLLCVVTQQSEPTTDPASGQVIYRPRTRLSAVDVADPDKPVIRGSLDLPNPDGAWSWNTVIHATAEFLFVATDSWTQSNRYSSVVHAIDLRSPDQPLSVGATFPLGGHLQSKFHLSYNPDAGVLTTVTQADGASVETWDVQLALLGMQPGLPRPLDTLVVGRGERLFGTRFDGDRVHVVTFRQIDPLFCIDQSDPRDLRLLGELEVPGFSTYLEAFADGTRLLSLGVEDFRVAVSLFDVADPANPALQARVRFGDANHGSWSEGNYDDKAIGFFRDAGLMVFPLASWGAGQGYRQGMQLVDVTADSLSARGFVAHQFNARRARLLGDVLVSISGTELIVVDVADRDHPRPLSHLGIAWPIDALLPLDEILAQAENGDTYQWDASASPRNARLRLTTKTDPDSPVAELDLGQPGAVIGLEHRGATAAVLLQMNYQREVKPDPSTPLTPAWEFASTLSVLAIDLSDPSAPKVTGRTTSEKPDAGWSWGAGKLRGHWLADGRLLWYPAEMTGGYWGRCFNCGIGIGLWGAVADIALPWWGGSSATDYVVVDVANPAEPRVLVREPVIPDDALVSAGGRAFVSAPDRLLVSWTTWNYTDTVWSEQSWAHEISLADPAHPVRTPVASVPGAVQGLYRTGTGGLILFTTRPEIVDDASGSRTWTQHAIAEALAYDGSQAFLLDGIRAEHSAYSQAAAVGRHLIVSQPRVDWTAGSPAGASLHVISWNEATGKLALLDPLSVATSYPGLHAESGFVFVSGGPSVDVIAAHQLPAAPARATFDLPASYWSASSVILDAPAREAWWNAGYYGVDKLDLSALPFPASAPRIARRDVPAAEWVTVAWSAFDVVSARAVAFPGLILPDADFKFVPDGDAESFEAWSARWFGGPVSPAADEDGDGFDAYAEWAFGSSPLDARSTPQVDFDVAHSPGQPPRLALVARFNPLAAVAPVSGNAALEMTPQVSTDLESWKDVEASGHEVIDSAGCRVLILNPDSEDAPATFFARLRVACVVSEE